MSSSKEEFFHKTLGSTQEITYKPTGQTAQISGRSLLTLAAMENIKPVASGCVSSKGIGILYSTVYVDPFKKDVISDTEFTGMYNDVEIRNRINTLLKPFVALQLKKPESDLTPEETKTEIDKIYKNILYVNASDARAVAITYQIAAKHLVNDMSLLKKQYQTCPSDQYFFIPLTLINISPTRFGFSNHANGIFISKAKGIVFRVEPQQSKEIEFKDKKKINEAIVKIVNQIGLKSPNLIEIKTTCPQAVVLDKNCIFWTTLIFEEIIKNLYKKDINTTIKEISLKPESELHKIIYDYKVNLFSNSIPLFLEKENYKWPNFEKNKSIIMNEIDIEYNKTTGAPIPVKPQYPVKSQYPVRIGGKTRRARKVNKTKKSKNRLARR